MTEEDWKKSGVVTKFPTYRKAGIVTTHSWLLGKRQDDEAEGLWRVYDTLYDLSDFVDKHPGGSFWLEQTKGTDITEAFETHHLTELPTKLMEKYKVREAKNPRIYKLTLKEEGFYKTLKRRVIEKLKTIDNTPKRKSDIIHTALLLSFFGFAIASLKFRSMLFLILAGATMCWTAIAAHNYFHRRDNWRMYTFNLSIMNFASWRISHAISHHAYPNSYLDLEMSMFEPLLCWVPNPYIKSLAMRYVSWITEPIVYIINFKLEMIIRIYYSIVHSNIMFWHDIIPLSIPLILFISTEATLLECALQWILITTVASIVFSVIGFNAAHHDPEIYHEGDATREDRDWGLYQVDSIIDRGDLKGSHLLVLTHFGDHVLHHLFPTLDHGILPQLYPVLYETLEEFKGHLREYTHLQHIIGQHKQLLRIKPNPIPPGSKLNEN